MAGTYILYLRDVIVMRKYVNCVTLSYGYMYSIFWLRDVIESYVTLSNYYPYSSGGFGRYCDNMILRI